MGEESERRSAGSLPEVTSPNSQELKGAIDSGRTGDKVPFFDPAAAPLGTDDEAAGDPPRPSQIEIAMRQELKVGEGMHRSTNMAIRANPRPAAVVEPRRPVSPNIQIYRPQLTSVLSILSRITGVILSIGAVGLVAWLIAGASGPQAYTAMQGAISSWIGQVMLFGFTFAFFLHLCGGIRHLVWDTVHGFELRQIYLSGWLVVAVSIVLTIVALGLSLLVES